MAPKGKKQTKKVPAPPLAAKKKETKTSKKIVKPQLFEKRVRSFRVGGDVQPKRDLTRFMRWPKYINLQRQKRILLTRLKVPPMVNQFNETLNKNQTGQLLKNLRKYQPETPSQKKQRLLRAADQQKAGKEVAEKKPLAVKYGLQQVTSLIENKKAKLVVIAHDVDPLELVLFLPTLCRKKDVPYCIVKGKSLLGQVVGKKHTSCLAVTAVRKEDQAELESLSTTCKTLFNDNVEVRRRWGGGIMGTKTRHVMEKREKVIAIEQAKKLGMQA